MSTRYSFTVAGDGVFPHALMETEGHWPASMGDAEAIAAAGFRRVDIEGPALPEMARWRGAGWEVTAMRTLRSAPEQTRGA